MSIGWQERYVHALAKAESWHAVEHIVWNEGVLGRVSPLDEAEFARRKKRYIDTRKRDDPYLYWRIIYSAHAALHHFDSRIMQLGYVTWAVALAHLSTGDLAPNKGLAANNASLVRPLLKEIVRRAEEKLLVPSNVEGLVPSNIEGLVPSNIEGDELKSPLPCLIPIGKEGVFKNAAVIVENYTPEGKVKLRGKSKKDIERLFNFTWGLIEPWVFESEFKPAD